MFADSTEPFRQVVVLAQQEARELRHEAVSSEHLLLGLLAQPECVATRALATLDVRLEPVRERVAQTVGRGEDESPEALPFTPRAKRLLGLAAEQSVRAGDDHLGTEHLLRALIDEDEAVAAGILRGLGVDRARVERGLNGVDPGAELRTAGAAAAGPTHRENGPRVTSRELHPETFDSATELAQAFGAPVLEPAWWPPDTEEIAYELYRSDRRVHYQIGSTRRDGVPICVVGHPEVDLGGRTPRDWLIGEWSEPAELAPVRGLIGRVGIPRRLQAAIYAEQLQLQLLGYATEAEIIRTVEGLRRAPA